MLVCVFPSSFSFPACSVSLVVCPCVSHVACFVCWFCFVYIVVFVVCLLVCLVDCPCLFFILCFRVALFLLVFLCFLVSSFLRFAAFCLRMFVRAFVVINACLSFCVSVRLFV